MKLLFHGDLGVGEGSAHRADAYSALKGISLVRSPFGPSVRRFPDLLKRVAWRLRRPLDAEQQNQQLRKLALSHRPDVIYIENSKVIRRSTLLEIRRQTGALLVYFSPDDIVARHNASIWLEQTWDVWDLFFTTKSFLPEELRERGVKEPILVGNVYTPHVHRPMTPEEVGPEFESFDVVFVGTFEKEREASLARLARSGLKVLVHGNRAGILSGGWEKLSRAGVTVRPAVRELEYTRALHRGKIALGFLRKMNRDQITVRSVELPAMARPMLAEKTPDHDLYFVDDLEYMSFRDDDELIAKAKLLTADSALRDRIATAGRNRCLESRYDVGALVELCAMHMRRTISASTSKEPASSSVEEPRLT